MYNEWLMKKSKSKKLRSEYHRKDLGKGIRGKYFKDYMAGSNLVLLSPDVAAVFPDEASVNRALRELIQLARKSAGPTHRSKRNS